MPDVSLSLDVVIVTWPNHPNRFRYLQLTVQTLKTLLKTDMPVNYLVSSESTPDPRCPWYGSQLSSFCRANEIHLHWRQAKPSLGGNMNSALRLCVSPYVLLVQDDVMLIQRFDPKPWVDLLRSDQKVSLIQLEHPPKPRVTTCRYGKHVRLVPPGRTYTDRAFLVRDNFIRKFGPYTETGSHGHSETAMQTKLQQQKAIVITPTFQYFQHFGTTTSVVNDKRNRRYHR